MLAVMHSPRNPTMYAAGSLEVLCIGIESIFTACRNARTFLTAVLPFSLVSMGDGDGLPLGVLGGSKRRSGANGSRR